MNVKLLSLKYCSFNIYISVHIQAPKSIYNMTFFSFKFGTNITSANSKPRSLKNSNAMNRNIIEIKKVYKEKLNFFSYRCRSNVFQASSNYNGWISRFVCDCFLFIWNQFCEIFLN